MIISDIANRRPVLAVVFNLLLVTFGLIAYQQLPLREYPDVDAPVVTVQTGYPGASAEIIEREVTQRLEDRIAGIEGIRYIESSSRDGRSSITIEFNLNRDIDGAANDIREAVSRVIRFLPDEVDPPQVTKADADASPILWLNLSSTTMDGLELADYARRYLVDRLSVVDGVALIRLGGAKRYAMRIWVDREALAARGLTVADIEDALRRENVELPAGRIDSLDREFKVRVDRMYRTAEDFAGLVIQRADNQHLVRLGEVAEVAVGSDSERTEFRGNGEDMVGLGIIRQANANVLDVANGAKRVAAELQEQLPDGTSLVVTYDSSVFIEGAIREVYITLAIATAAVVLVIYLFLGSWRATLIPGVTVPVAITAAFIGISLLGFSVNLLTLLALVLAIGLVVDDAIVMLENIHRRIERGEPGLLAAYRGARQVGFAIVATTSVLVAVFVPLAFLSGTVGRLFTEFALAIAIAVVFSSLVALTLAPVLSGRLMHKGDDETGMARIIGRGFGALERGYARLLQRSLPYSWGVVPILLLSLGGAWWLLNEIPDEFAPREDRGAFFVLVNGPEGASFEYMREQMAEVERRMLPLTEQGEVRRILVRTPRAFGNTEVVNNGFVIVIMHHWNDRERLSWEVMEDINASLAEIPGIQSRLVMRQGLSRGRIGQPVQFVITGPDYDELAEWGQTLLERAEEIPGLARLDLDYKPTQPQVTVRIDRDRAADLGVSLATVGRTLDVMLGGRAVTTYIDRGEEYDVIIEGRSDQRRTPGDISNLYVRSDSGELIPLSSLVSYQEVAGAGSLERYNRARSVTLSAAVQEGYTLGQVLAALDAAADEVLPPEARIDYKGESLDLREGSQAVFFTFVLALVIVYLVLAAQFESFVHPFVIMLTVPLAVVGALLGLYLTGQTINIYSQIGMVMLIGLAAKNGILIVEFANQLRDHGREFSHAVVEAASMRLRPVLMTALTTVAGSIPLILATGPGAETRFVIGIAVFSGVLFATLFTLFVIPASYGLLARQTTSPKAMTRRIEQLDSRIDDVDRGREGGVA
ncbi:RND multidrug efflux transporter; Acriflavin resistance protein [Thioalkalivibrio nitratireducens DSM 14787]|uniref:RND multidrug efflux transporter Acriflavin resistance protein n=1 Tax=Thioalkalivibrio nitratireducens (strain DSM 14787 / UNIQEM 213 / ALEN2) TaxID=1255043 RepID=L0DSK6_THIND|nr:efflux RND transporter permease subunit [Thioalkalivibrio nitratireducens]AGA31988.1 RND multidrug efflux transporter; Acriflavin resistance protein [Thioalkalivibrio nitratireducens DSM 14787]